MKVVVIDNYDSFTYNLVQYMGALGAEIVVYRNDAATLKDVIHQDPDAIVISPGPGNPHNPRYVGIAIDVIKELGRDTPTLGVCIGHQMIGATFGAKVMNASRLMHGKPADVEHDGKTIFEGIPNPFVAGRYHSLTVDKNTIPKEFEITSTCREDGEIMGIRHREFPIEGIQFHPESILTPKGENIVENFLKGVRI